MTQRPSILERRTPTIVPKVGIGEWDTCFKPGPCPCSNPCTWVAPLIRRGKPSPTGKP
jgi:hypothetical protein